MFYIFCFVCDVHNLSKSYYKHPYSTAVFFDRVLTKYFSNQNSLLNNLYFYINQLSSFEFQSFKNKSDSFWCTVNLNHFASIISWEVQIPTSPHSVSMLFTFFSHNYYLYEQYLLCYIDSKNTVQTERMFDSCRGNCISPE